ncbi:DDRGK domain-containing protein 1 [Pelomyxa schiedti]|nr:DDRGK domain-containing protein 1 [Pelomyxa schiedti]
MDLAVWLAIGCFFFIMGLLVVAWRLTTTKPAPHTPTKQQAKEPEPKRGAERALGAMKKKVAVEVVAHEEPAPEKPVIEEQHVDQPEEEENPAEEPEHDSDGEEAEEAEETAMPKMKGGKGKKYQEKMRKKEEKRQAHQALTAAREARIKKHIQEEEEFQEKQEKKLAEKKKQEEEEAKIKKERTEREEAEYSKWKGGIELESSGSKQSDASRFKRRVTEFIQYFQRQKVTAIEDAACEFRVKPLDVVEMLNELEEEGKLFGLLDESGKFINLTMDEMKSFCAYITRRGRVSLSDLTRETNRTIKLT